MTVSDLIARGIQIELHEAVAIVRDMVDRGGIAVSSSVPELHQVEIVPAGHVEIHGGRRVSEPVKELTELLQTLVPSTTLPTQLQLLASYPLQSVEEFSNALAYFERPNRPVILQALFQRASGAEAAADPDALIASLRAATTGAPTAATDAEQEARKAARLKKLLLGVAALGLIAAIGGAIVVMQRRGGGSDNGESPSLTARVSEKVAGVTSAVGSAVASIGERVGISGPPAPAPAPVEAAEPDKPEKTAPTARSRREPRRADAGVRNSVPSLPSTSAATKDVREPLPTAMTSVVVRAEPAPDLGNADPGVVYTASSPDVTAPVPLRPQLPRVTVAEARQEDIARIELLISADGRVESVKLLDEPRTVHDSMLLSAAKAWRFRPAMKDGSPVWFRTIVVVGRDQNK